MTHRRRIVVVTKDMLARQYRPQLKGARKQRLKASLGEWAIEKQMRRAERQQVQDGYQG